MDGTFRPDNQITLEEACAALLTMLGYDSASLVGSYPAAQLSKAAAIGLRDDLDAVQGQALTRQDCVTLFYNLMVSETSGGSIYGTTLGYTIANGEIDYATLISKDTKGPYIASNGTVSLPFSTSGATVYRDGALSSLSAVQSYDIYYYNANLRTVWVYSDRVSGTLTEVSPSGTAPSSVTVAGTSYELGTSTAVYKCSSQGSFSKGDVVTLLLGMNGEVVDVISPDEAESICYGVVQSSKKTADDTANVQIETQVACTDGSLRTFYHRQSTFSTGTLVSVTVDSSGTTVKSLSSKSLSGTVNSAGTTFAGYTFAADVEILDTDSEGGYVRVYPSRLAGSRLSGDDVAYYTLDENGEIDRMILDEVTGDTADYVYITAFTNNSKDMSISASYTYFQNGTSTTLNSNALYSATTGGAALYYKDGALKSMRQLTSVTLTELSDLYAMAGTQKYTLDEEVQVLLRDTGSGYYAVSLSSVDTEDYTLKGWYDDFGYSAGGWIRVIVATAK